MSGSVARSTIDARITVSRDEIAAFCRRHHICRLGFFGSVLREDFREDSDVDVLVEFEPGRVPGFFGMAEMQRELTELLGRRADLRTPEDLSRYFREEVVAATEWRFGHHSRNPFAPHARRSP